MPQLLIDSNTDSPKILRLTAQYLDDLAMTIEKELAGPQYQPPPPAINEGQIDHVTATGRIHDFKTGADQPQLDPAKIFGTPPVPSSVAMPPVPPMASLAPPMATAVASPVMTQPVTTAPTIPAAPGPRAPDEFDAAGMPYDNRIHSLKRSKVIAGTWKYLKGASKDNIAKVEAENQARRQPPINATPPAPAQMPLPPMAPPAAAAPYIPPVSLPPPPPPPAPLAPNPGQPSSALEFRTVMTKITAAMGAGKLTLDQMTPFLESKGLPAKAIVAIGDRPDIWQECIAYVDWYTNR